MFNFHLIRFVGFGAWMLFFSSHLFSNSPISGIQDSIPRPQTTTRKSFYVEPGSYGTKRETDPPDYIHSMDDLGYNFSGGLDWLNVGMDYRTRNELRINDIRRPESKSTDFPMLLRYRAFIGVKEKLDPFRFSFELEDARRNNGKYPLDTRDANEFELIGAFGELHFKNLLGKDPLGNNRPVFIRYGRQAFEFLDRRLIGLNRWRNTTNTFSGFRASIGQDANDWHVDLLALQPIDRLIEKFDEVNKDRYFSALIGHWRKNSEIITLEPHYMWLKQNPSSNNGNITRNIHALGLRISGKVYASGWNYDFSGMVQFGKDGVNDQKAFSVVSEVGYAWKQHKMKPRLSAFYGFVSGDKDPNDKVSNRFERFYGFARPWSADDYIVMENISIPKLKIEFQPIKGLRVDGGYCFYWLASDTDRFNNLLAGSSNNRDRTGQSGKFMGHGFDFRTNYKFFGFIGADFGFAHFVTGDFVRNRQFVANGVSSNSSDFVYLELSYNFFDLVKKRKAQL